MNTKTTEIAPQNNQRSQAESEEDYITSQKSRTIENAQETVQRKEQNTCPYNLRSRSDKR